MVGSCQFGKRPRWIIFIYDIQIFPLLLEIHFAVVGGMFTFKIWSKNMARVQRVAV
jgi:hypothetical protein